MEKTPSLFTSSLREREREREGGRQAGRQAGRQTDRDRQTDKESERERESGGKDRQRERDIGQRQGRDRHIATTTKQGEKNDVQDRAILSLNNLSHKPSLRVRSTISDISIGTFSVVHILHGRKPLYPGQQVHRRHGVTIKAVRVLIKLLVSFFSPSFFFFFFFPSSLSLTLHCSPLTR